jgi:hypothetical protein
MSAAKSTKKTVTRKRVNLSQPSQILKQKQVTKLRALLEEEKRQAEARKQFENFLKQYAMPPNNNNTNTQKNKKRKTRRLRR